MGVQQDFYSTDGQNKTFPSTKHIATKQHMAVWLRQKLDTVEVQLDPSKYELITNAAVLNSSPSTILYDRIEIRVADSLDELTSSPSAISVVAGIAEDVVTVAGIESEVVTVADDTVALNLVADDLAKGIGTNQPTDSAILNALTNATQTQADVVLAAASANEAAASAASVNNPAQTITELLSFDTSVGYVNVLGYHTANDGGGGIFNYDATIDKSTANGGTIIDPSVSLALQGTGVGLGCWVRQYVGVIDLRWFGIKIDNLDASAPDNTTKLQALFELASTNGWSLSGGNGYCKFNAPLTIRESLQLEGEGISKSRSSTGDINDRGLIFKYIGVSTSDYLITVADPSPSTSVYMYGTHLKKIRLDCGGSINGMQVRGVNELFNMEDIEIGNYTGVGLDVDRETTTLRVNNQATMRRIKLVPSSTVAGTAKGMVTKYCHRMLFEAITVDMQGSDSTEPIHRGFIVGQDTRDCVFINPYAENCTVGVQLGSDIEAENDTTQNNVFIGTSVEAPEIEPADTTIDTITDTIAFLVNKGVKTYSITGLYSTKQFGASPNTYAYLLYDSQQGRGVERSSPSSANDKLISHIAAENRFGKELWMNDALHMSNVVEASDIENSLTSNSTYPSVDGFRCVKTNNSVATTMTGFGDGVEGQIIEFRIRDGNTAIDSDNAVSGDNILLLGGTDLPSININSMFTFRKRGTAWIETSRMLR